MTESQGESNNATATTPPPQPLLERLKDYGQEDAFALWDELSLEERDLLVKDIEVISFSFLYNLDLSADLSVSFAFYLAPNCGINKLKMIQLLIWKFTICFFLCTCFLSNQTGH